MQLQAPARLPGLARCCSPSLRVALEHASSLMERLPTAAVDHVRWLCWHSAWRVAYDFDMPGRKEPLAPKKLAAEVEKARAGFEKHKAAIAQLVPAALATSLAQIGADAGAPSRGAGLKPVPAHRLGSHLPRRAT